jgi:hypothetical protein
LGKIRRELLGYDADLPGNGSDDVKLIQRLLDGVDRVPLIEVDKPGFTPSGKGFVLGARMFGDARERYWWREVPDTHTVGETAGTKKGWDEVGALLAHSSFATLAVLAMLASPVRKYLELRASPSRPRAPLISETATFNFVGLSGSGKTVLGAIAASVTGHPENRAIWDFSRRGLEEYLASRNHIGGIIDDMEKQIGQDLSIKKAIKIITEYAPGGVSKQISKTVETKGLDRKTWDTFVVSSSPTPTDQVMKGASEGHKVRFMDLILPARRLGGIIDEPPPNVDRVAFAKKTIARFEGGISTNYGHLYPAWMRLLLDADRSDDLIEWSDYFLRQVASPGESGYDERFARKYALLYAVGQLAAKNHLFRWPAGWPFIAVSRCYRNALATAHREQTLVAQALSRLQAAVSAGRFLPAREETGYIRVLRQGDCGVLHRHRGVDVVGLTDLGLQEICCDRSVAKALVALLRTKHIHVGGHGHAGTTQIPIQMRIYGKVVDKPRFWLFDCAALMALGKTRRGKSGSTETRTLQRKGARRQDGPRR